MARTKPKKGRPDLQGSMELDTHLMATAAKLFIANGYEGTSMGQIAAAAGAGKQSLYRRYPNKEALFEDVFVNFIMKKILTRNSDQIRILDREGSREDENGLETLHEVARQSFNFILEQETIDTFRLFIAEQSRFPELNQQVRNMIQAMEENITKCLQKARNSGFIRTNIDQGISRNFMALINAGPLIQALIDFPSLEDEKQRERYFEGAWKTFTDAVSLSS
jgi:AcrR family transcriptional regulator